MHGLRHKGYHAYVLQKEKDKKSTARDRGSFVDSLKSATRIRVGSALAPAPVADRTFKPLRTQAASSATYYINTSSKKVKENATIKNDFLILRAPESYDRHKSLLGRTCWT